MDPTFTGKGDAMPDTRNKYIHHVGAVGMVEFVPNGASGYTGMFAEAKVGIARLSSAAKPSNGWFSK